MSSTGIKISKPGVDVKTADDKDLVWSSNYKTWKIYKIVHFTSAGSETHGLTYPPTFVALIKEGTSWGSASLGYQELGYSWVSVDDINVYSSTSDEVYVILFIDPLNE